MGVSMYWRPVRGGRERYLRVGWRSMFYGLLLDRGLLGDLDEGDIETLREIAKNQKRGVKEPPFDWSQDIADACEEIILAIQKHKTVSVYGLW